MVKTITTYGVAKSPSFEAIADANGVKEFETREEAQALFDSLTKKEQKLHTITETKRNA